METEEGTVESSEFVVSQAEVWVALGLHCGRLSEMGTVSRDWVLTQWGLCKLWGVSVITELNCQAIGWYQKAGNWLLILEKEITDPRSINRWTSKLLYKPPTKDYSAIKNKLPIQLLVQANEYESQNNYADWKSQTERNTYYMNPLTGFPGGASGKEPTCQCKRQKRHGFDPWIWKIPWRRTWKLTVVILPGEFHGQRSLEGCSP